MDGALGTLTQDFHCLPVRKASCFILITIYWQAAGQLRKQMGALVLMVDCAMCRMYIEQYSADTSKHGLDAQDALAPIIKIALDLSKLKEFTGREKPTVIT